MRVENPWYRVYFFGVVPVIIGILGFVALRGDLRTRLLFLNSAIVLGLLAEFIWAVAKDAEALMGLPVLPVIVLGFCGGVSVIFIATDIVSKRMRPHAT